MKKALAVFGTLLTIAITGCTSGGHIDTVRDYKNPEYKGGKFKKVLIVVLTRDPALRQDIEQEFAGRLVAQQVNGISSRTMIPDPSQVNKDSVKALVEREGIDAVLVIRGMGITETGIHTNAADWFVHSEMAYYNSFYNYWDTATIGVFTMGVPPSGTQQYIKFQVEATLYETKGATLVWSTLSKATTSREIGETRKDYVAVVLRSLGRYGLI